MGIFSDKKIINVSSVLYNMAGDENDRPNFLKGTIFGSVISGSPSLADDLTTALFDGPGMEQRKFFKYANRNNLSGLPSTTIRNNQEIDPTLVAPHVPATSVPPAPAGITLTVNNAEALDGDFEPWVQRWILQNHPTRFAEDWLGEYNPDTDMFSVEFPNADFFTWANNVAPIYDPSKRYIVAKYVEEVPSSEDAVVPGTPTTGVTSLPDTSTFLLQSDTGTSTNVNLVRNRTTIWSYSNGDPDVTHEDNVSADVPGVLNTAVEVWQKEVIVSTTGVQATGERQIWNFTGTDTVVGGYSNVVVTQTDLGGGVIRTETATTTGEQVAPSWTTQYDTQALYIGFIYNDSEQIFIYEVGSGNATLDALVDTTNSSGLSEFFPFMPIRINNKSIEHPDYAALFAEMKPAYRKAYQGKNFRDLVAKVEDNPSIDDIDYAYLTWGVSLNVKENEAKKYIFKFLENLQGYQSAGSSTAISSLLSRISAYGSQLGTFNAWLTAMKGAGDWSSISSRPAIPGIGSPSTNTIRLNDAALGFDYRLQWVNIEIQQIAGTFDTDAECTIGTVPNVDDVHLENGSNTTWTERESYNNLNENVSERSNTVPKMNIFWQIDPGNYRKLSVWGLISQNFIYKGKSVKITSEEALNDIEESGFLIPLHEPTMSEMGIVSYTQLATANAHVLFNTYTITVQKWYQRGIFRILLVIAIIVIAVIAFPSAFAAGGGILGGNLALGAALGFTGTAAIVAGVVANYIAAMVISELLKVAGTELFGEKWGAVFAAVAGFALTASTTGLDIMSTEGILGLGNALANGYAGWVQGDIAEMNDDLEDDQKEYERQMSYIDGLMSELGGNDLNFNPLFLTDTGIGNVGSKGYLPETVDQYIQRTTMTASDIVELTHSMVYDYVDIAKTLPRN